MTVKDTGPLSWNVPIVTPDGRPTPEFQRRWETQRDNNSKIGSVGGTDGQIQYNDKGAFGGFTVSGDGTIDTSTGDLVVTKTNGVAFAASATINTTNAGNISSGTLADSRLSTNVPLKASANTFTVGQQVLTSSTPSYLQLNSTGSYSAIVMKGGINTALTCYEFSNDANCNNWYSIKGRGSYSSPSAVLQNDYLGSFLFSAFYSSSNYILASQLKSQVIEPSPSSTAMATRLILLQAKLGTTAQVETAHFDADTGLTVLGHNVAGSSGLIIPNSGVTAGSYTSANITVGADGRVTSASNGSGGGGGGGLWSSQITIPTTSSIGMTTALGGATISNTTPGILISGTSGSGAYTTTVPSTPYTITALLASSGSGAVPGFGWTDGTKIQFMYINPANGNIVVQSNTNITTYLTANFTATSYGGNTRLIWFQLNDDGTSVHFRVSADGANYIDLFDVVKSTGFLGATGYSHLFAGSPGGTSTQLTTLLSWLQT